MPLYLEESNRRLDELVLIARTDLDRLARITVEGLIVIDVHGTIENPTKLIVSE